METQSVQVNAFPQGLGFALNPQNVERMEIHGKETVHAVYTIENLTTFFRFQKDNSIIVYLGGYHNHIRRELLKKIYRTFPDASYFHFGDMDAGGFQIYYHLKDKTKIPFRLYQMDLDTLKKYEVYGRKLTENDRKRLKKIQEEMMGEEERNCVEYMLAHNVKLEQECIAV